MDPQNFTTPSSSGRNRSRVTSSTTQTSNNPGATNPFYVNSPSPFFQQSPPPFFQQSPPPLFQQPPLFQPQQWSYTGMLNQTSEIPFSDFGTPMRQQRDDSSSPDEQREEHLDFVPETQQRQTEPSQPTKGKGRAKPKPWTPDEEVALVKAYIDCSEDSVRGNAQKRDRFWDRVRVAFERQLGKPDGYRTDHQVTSKYKDINTKVSKFSAIYNNIYNTRRSGMSDVDILTLAHNRYREENNGTNFSHQRCWDILKSSPKWHPIPTMEETPRPSKRSKTSESNRDSMTASSDAHAPFNLNDDDDGDNDDDGEPIEPVRPVGRNKAKRSASTSTGTGSKESVTTLLDSLSKIHTDNTDYITVRQKEVEVKVADRMEKDYEFYIRPHDHLTGGALTTTLKMKETIRNKYNWDPL